jgi:L-ascorbate metabolism protein UlaG (beta-lactamase superfamily)
MKQATFWLAVAGTALVADPVFSLAADSQVVSKYFPALKTLNDYRTRRNG